MELGGDCVAGVPEAANASRLQLLRHIVTAQLSLLKRAACLPLYSRAAVRVSSAFVPEQTH